MAVMAITANAQKYALIDMEYILKNVPAYERANEQLNQVSKKWQAEVEALNIEASTMYKNYQNEVVFLSQEQKKAKQEAIMNKEKEASELKKKYFGPEGELINKLQEVGFSYDGVVLNAGAYTHTSIALQDCIRSMKCPVVEVHISNVHKREEFRHHSYLSAACLGVICGFGLASYDLAIAGILAQK